LAESPQRDWVASLALQPETHHRTCTLPFLWLAQHRAEYGVEEHSKWLFGFGCLGWINAPSQEWIPCRLSKSIAAVTSRAPSTVCRRTLTTGHPSRTMRDRADCPILECVGEQHYRSRRASKPAVRNNERPHWTALIPVSFQWVSFFNSSMRSPSIDVLGSSTL
jgi:hypothetical protein